MNATLEWIQDTFSNVDAKLDHQYWCKINDTYKEYPATAEFYSAISVLPQNMCVPCAMFTMGDVTMVTVYNMLLILLTQLSTQWH